MRIVRLDDGTVITTELNNSELLMAMDRLDALISLTGHTYEFVGDYDDDVLSGVFKKATTAYDKTCRFTGIVKLTATEKKVLRLVYDNEFLLSNEKEALEHYLNIKEEM